MKKTKKKVQLGQFFTRQNPFILKPFIDWYNTGPNKLVAIEPFAGANNIVDMLPYIDFYSFDIDPKDDRVIKRDTLKNFPDGYGLCITNPPYLAKNSATRRKLWYPNTSFEDLYQYSLDICLKNCGYVAAIIPESFITSGLFHNRLVSVISLNFKMFDDTDCPVCLALFSYVSDGNFEVWSGNKFIGKYKELIKLLPININNKFNISFNVPDGRLGLIAIDSTFGPSICFVDGNEISPNEIKASSRAITRISIPSNISLNKLIKQLNYNLYNIRNKTHDVFMTSFKGLRKDAKYRRRLDFKLAKALIQYTLIELNE